MGRKHLFSAPLALGSLLLLICATPAKSDPVGRIIA